MAVTSTRKQKSARRPRRAARRSPAGRRWVVLSVALGVAAVALYVLVTAGSRGPVASRPPGNDIDDASRARLERVLLDADRAEERGR